ncbi:MAG: hypothetical protein ACTSU2_10945 [Promethearchaeota archaeon]
MSSESSESGPHANPNVPKLEGTPKRVVCFGCSLLCDDVYVELKDNGDLIRTVNSCFRGTKFLREYKQDLRITAAFQKSMGLMMNLDPKEVLDYLEEQIGAANSIKLYGIGALGFNDQVAVFKFIKLLLEKGKNVTVESCGNVLRLITELGIPVTTIGQGINIGDVFLAINADPTHTHPKITSKLVFSRGYFRSAGKEIKRLVIIQEGDNDLEKSADLTIKNAGQSYEELFKNIVTMIEKNTTDGVKIGDINELNIQDFKRFLEETEYGLLITTIPESSVEARDWLLKIKYLIDMLNKYTKGQYALIPLTLESNEMNLSIAALSTLNSDEIEKIQETEDANKTPKDIAIVFGGEYLRDEYKTKEYVYPEKKIILFDNFKSPTSKRAKITIPYSMPGIEKEDYAIRLDSVSVGLKKWSEPPIDVWPIEKMFAELIKRLNKE